MNKKILVVILILVLAFSLSSCGSEKVSDNDTIICVEYFSYDWVRNILGDELENYNLVLLNETGKDMHSFEPSASDMVKMLESDYLIYLGGISESWIDDFLMDKDISYTSLMDEFINSDVAKNYELDMNDIDEHIFLSPVISSELIRKLGENLEGEFNNSKFYTNASLYADEVLKLKDTKIGEYPIVVCDRFPFDYLSKDMGFQFFAAFDGCSAETEASFSVILELVNAINDNSLDRVYVIENSDASIAEQVIAASNLSDVKIIELNSLQSVTDMSLSYLDTLSNIVNLISDGTFKG